MSAENQQNESMPQPLFGRKVLLGITGGIAAYKSAELLRLLKKAGATVQVVMTYAAQAFVQPLTYQALSGLPVRTELLDENAEAAMGHIELAKWPDLILIAPCSADFIAKLAQGRGDDLLSTLCLATARPIALAPAMNQQMWNQQTTRDNLDKLQHQKTMIWGPASGEQACGDVGLGRMEEPLQLYQHCEQFFQISSRLKGVKVLVTAGPTQEDIDPVRYIGNRSSGKMGYAVCEALKSEGAEVTLVSGPVQLAAPVADRIEVLSAGDMFAEVMKRLPQIDVFIGCAAVSDYRVENPALQKIKKTNEQLVLTLVKNPDIIKEVSYNENRPRWVIGFAAETENLQQNAKSKLINKNLDMICANDVSEPDCGFGSDTNRMTVFIKQGDKVISKEIALGEKEQVAQSIVATLADYYNK